MTALSQVDEFAAAPPPNAGSEQVELYLRTYTTLLRSSGELRLRTLESTHIGMHSSLHALAGSPEPDLGAFIYATQRLPACITQVQHVILGQSAQAFRAVLGEDVTLWPQVEARGRRRRWHYDGHERLAVFIAGQSDVDDLIPSLTAWQIEWNKLHLRLRSLPHPAGASLVEAVLTAPEATLGGSVEDWARLRAIWGDEFPEVLQRLSEGDRNLTARLLGGTLVGYARATADWWRSIEAVLAEQGLLGRPLYFVSSNTHCLINLLSGVALRHEQAILADVVERGDDGLRDELAAVGSGISRANRNNLLYYAARRFFNDQPKAHAQRMQEEQARGIFHVSPRAAIEVAAQVFALDRLRADDLDPRLGDVNAARLAASDAVIVNIDYPLGLAGYNIMRQVMERTDELRGVYVLGKAATLNAGVGDVMIADVVHDEHSLNTYWLDNCFGYEDVGPFLIFGSALDHQRAVTVKGTFLQNRGYLDMYHRDAYTAVEMEAGPYLDALYEGARAERYPTGQSINFSKLPFDLGIIHYASDTPFTQARTLGARALDYRGMDSTYAGGVAIVRRILRREGVTGG
jgi:hypothetical protein